MTADRGFFLLAKAEVHAEGPRLFHTVPPPGEYPSTVHKKDGTKEAGILVVDDQAYASILAAFKARSESPAFAGLLVDREHASESPDGDTSAAAWAKSMIRKDDGIWTGWDLTPVGEQLLISGVYKFRSPVFNLEKVPGTGDRYRPTELVSIGLTNKPHFKQLAPSLNREDAAPNPKETQMQLIDRIRAMLKAPPEMSEDDLCGQLEKAISAAAELPTVQARATELANAAMERDATEFVSKHKDRFSDEAKLKALFKADRKAADELVAILKPLPAAAPARVLSREDGQAPAAPISEDAQAIQAKAKAQTELCNQIRARDEYRDASFATIWAVAQREKPDLFTK